MSFRGPTVKAIARVAIITAAMVCAGWHLGLGTATAETVVGQRGMASGAPVPSGLWPEESATLWPAAIFGQDNRRPMWELRRRDPGTLNAEERAILQAAARIGSIGCSSGGSNATLIQLEDGRDAVITSAHSFIGQDGPRCDLSTVKFLPNVSYYDGGDWGDYTDFVLRIVPTTGELPLNGDNPDVLPAGQEANGGQIPIGSDFLIFVLGEQISEDIMPDGNTRGFVRLSSYNILDGHAVLISKNNDFLNGAVVHDACRYRNASASVFHLCATTNTSSSSALLQLVDGELVLIGIHSRAFTFPEPVPVPTRIEVGGNEGVSADFIRLYLERIRQPALTAPLLPEAVQQDSVKPEDVAPAAAAEVEL